MKIAGPPSSASAAAPTTKSAEAPKESAGSAAAKDAIFTVKALNTGKPVSLAPGEVTVVDFCATWREPCKKSFPKLQALYMKYQAGGLEIIGLSVDDEEAASSRSPSSSGQSSPSRSITTRSSRTR